MRLDNVGARQLVFGQDHAGCAAAGPRRGLQGVVRRPAPAAIDAREVFGHVNEHVALGCAGGLAVGRYLRMVRLGHRAVAHHPRDERHELVSRVSGIEHPPHGMAGGAARKSAPRRLVRQA